MTTARLVWITALVLAGLAPLALLIYRQAFDPADRKKAFGFLLLGFAGLFVAGWFLLPAPEEGGEAVTMNAAPPLPPA